MTNIDELLGNPTELRAVPAYGRQYLNAPRVEKDWHDGVDFKIARGPYFSIRDTPRLLADGYTEVWVFYKPNTRPAVLELKA